MKCPHCNHELPGRDAFKCPSCGGPIPPPASQDVMVGVLKFIGWAIVAFVGVTFVLISVLFAGCLCVSMHH